MISDVSREKPISFPIFSWGFVLALMFFFATPVNAVSQSNLSSDSRNGPFSCDTSGNWIFFGNYDGGKLNIVIDQNIPNLKVGICTYEPVIVTFSGAFVSNIVDVYYAGFNSAQNNNHCGFPISTSSFLGVNPALVTVDVVPPVNITSPPNPNLPNGNNSGVVTVVSCDTSTYQGGGNTIDQVIDVFQQRFGGSLRGLVVQYCCWLDVDFYRLSAVTGRCCNTINAGVASINFPSGPFCIGSGLIVPAILGDSSGTFVSNPPSLPINSATGVVDLNSASPGTYVITYSIPFN
jgi:hypothetical protein